MNRLTNLARWPFYLAVLLLLISSHKTNAQNFALERDVIDAAGGVSSSANFHKLSASGQATPVGSAQSANFAIAAGFLPLDLSAACNPSVCPGPAVFPTAAGGALGEPIEGSDGETICIDIRLKENPSPVAAFGFQVQVNPVNLTFVSAAAGDLTSGFVVLDAAETPPGSGLINCGGFGTTPIPANSAGVLVRLCFTLNWKEVGGPSPIRIVNLSDDVEGFANCCNLVRGVQCVSNGDVNGDGALTPGDALCAFESFLRGGSLSEECDVENFECELVASDVNCDGTTTPGDALAIFERFLQGLAPEACFARPGLNAIANGYSRTHRQGPAFQSSQAQLDLSTPADTTVAPGDTITVPLLLTNPEAANIRAFGLTFFYPTDLLAFIKTENKSTLTEGWIVANGQENVPGEIRIGAFNITGATASGVLMNVIFQVVKEAAGVDTLKLRSFRDDVASATTTDGAIAAGIKTNVASEPARIIPDEFGLMQNYPNPFNPETRLTYLLPHASHVRIEVFNTLGQRVALLIDEKRPAGTHRVEWRGRNDFGQPVASGVYILSMRAGDFVQQRRMVLMR